MDDHEDETTGLYCMIMGRHDDARAIIRTLTKEQLQKLSDALDYYAVLVDEQLIRNEHQERT